MTIQTLSREEVASVSGADSNRTLPLITPLVSSNIAQAFVGAGFTALGNVFKNQFLSGLVEVGGGSLSKLLASINHRH
ncbi:hypothetical protein [Solimonas terrae]|uniref:Uncharacterized protein n=1 Tax=Solimonas terrae TaxID=1396819 RepID=A0A6M2BX30_9GAMM|nr:hypothetical protein [Solimonas terrae]NGY07058.1 hypothetical protein [Solimonas terrae]